MGETGEAGNRTIEIIEVCRRGAGSRCFSLSALTSPRVNAVEPDQVYGAGTSSLFAVQLAEDESSFSVVDNSRTSTKARSGFGRGGGTIFRGRGQRGAANARGGRGGFQRVGGGRGGPAGNDRMYDSRGGRGGRGRRFGWKDYDKPQRNRDASVNIKADWKMLEEIDFNRLAKLNLETDDGQDVDSYGFLYYYDRTYDKQPVKGSERKLNVIDRAAYNVTTSSDPVIQELAEKDEATIFATDSILSMLMCAPRSVYPWDIVILRQGDKVYLDKRDGSSLDMVTVNENAADAPMEQADGNKDAINNPAALAFEATFINHNFTNQTVTESDTQKYRMAHENPFYNPSEETESLALKAYRYRRFDLSLNNDEQPLHLIVRTELDAVTKNTSSGEDQFLTVKALNEFDHKAQGSGGALDWRTKLVSQRGAVVATEMKNNSCKLARWTSQSILARADVMKLGYVFSFFIISLLHLDSCDLLRSMHFPLGPCCRRSPYHFRSTCILIPFSSHLSSALPLFLPSISEINEHDGPSQKDPSNRDGLDSSLVPIPNPTIGTSSLGWSGTSRASLPTR